MAHAKKVDVQVSPTPLAIGPSADKANTAIGGDTPRLLRLFRELHEQTQWGRIEAQLAGAIASELAALKFDVAFGADGTEVVATLHNGPGPTLIYRAETGGDRITLPGPMARARHLALAPSTHNTHHCGFDANVTWMLGMAKAVTALRTEWSGTLVLVSQPTRLLGASEPVIDRNDSGRRVPKPDIVLALSATPAPLGSILSIRGQHRPGADTADVAMGRTGAYEAPQRLEQVTRLATSTTNRFGLPDDGFFGYLLVGIESGEQPAGSESDQRPDPGDTDGSELDPSALAEADGAGLDLAAIPLGTKLATVAVLELLAKAKPVRQKKHSAPALEWTEHNY